MTVRYAIGSEDSGAASADLTIPLDGSEDTARLPLTGCDAGCVVTGLDPRPGPR